MALNFEVLDSQDTALGELVLRRRLSPAVPGEWVYEVTLDHEMLMSSVVNASERALARIALEGRAGQPCDVLVGGLGLGYTAAAALEHPFVRSAVVVELLAPVVSWHRDRLVPLAAHLMDDPRCRFVEADFFEHVGSEPAGERYDAILLDIDHSPDCWLRAGHGHFYNADGPRRLARHLKPRGVFAVWSAWEPAQDFLDALGAAFPTVETHEIPFRNPHLRKDVSNWIVTAEGAGLSQPPVVPG